MSNVWAIPGIQTCTWLEQFSSWSPLLRISSTWFLPHFSFQTPRYSFHSAREEKAKGSCPKAHFSSSKSRAEHQSREPEHPACAVQANFARSEKKRREWRRWNQAQIFHYYINQTIHRWHILSCLDAFLWIQKINFLNWTKLVFLHSCAFPCCWQRQID